MHQQSNQILQHLNWLWIFLC